MKVCKSLRNSLLEYAVYNFSEIFHKFKDPSGNCDTILPPFLFQDVISKSDEIRWKIPEQELLECLPCRESLRWEYNNLTLTSTDLKSFAPLSSMNRIIKHLSVDTACIGDFVIEQISVFGLNLLSLELNYSRMTISKLSNTKFPILRKLAIKRKSSLNPFPKSFEFDFLQNPDTLEELRIENEFISLSLISSIKCLSNLKTLSFYCCKFNPLEEISCIEELGSLIGLRTLHFTKMNVKFKEPVLYDTLKRLAHLENMDLSRSSYNESDFERILNNPPRKWKKLGLYGLNRQYHRDPRINALADQVFGTWRENSPVPENLLDSAEYYTKDYFKVNDQTMRVWLNNLFDYHHLLPDDKTPRIEKIMLDVIEKDYKSEDSHKLWTYIKSERCTPEFIKKIIGVLFCHGRSGYRTLFMTELFNPFVLDFIHKDLNRSVNKKLMQQISSIYVKKEFSYASREFLDLCENALKKDLFDSEIRKSMSKIVITAKLPYYKIH